mgnify:CR=1 FL=1
MNQNNGFVSSKGLTLILRYMPNNLHNDHKLEVYPLQTIFSSPNPIFYPGLQEMTLYIAVARVLMLPMIISGVYDKLFFF